MVKALSVMILFMMGLNPAQSIGMQRGIGLEARCHYTDKNCRVYAGADKPGVQNCTSSHFNQTLDHFDFAHQRTFQQRYFTYSKYWSPGGPIFFYCGNEANVELYVNATGLMWENAQSFGAMLVFVEHRYYGETLPFGAKSFSPSNLQWLTMEQALADYQHLIHTLKHSLWDSPDSPVIAFGGSYGGMLAAWLRMKYPSAVNGAIAGSAPVLAFQGLPSSYKAWGSGESYWQVVTRDATAEAGAASRCADNIRRVWPLLFSLAKTPEGRLQLTESFKLCKPLASEADAMRLALMHLNAFDTMAMGNFPYPSNYLVFQQTQNPDIELPAYPVREACKHLEGPLKDTSALFEGMADASGVFYNVTGLTCYDLPVDPDFDGIWDYQWCTEMLPQETYFTRDGVHDMFWPSPMNMSAINAHCRDTLGVVPRSTWIGEEFGGITGASNIVFSNGLYDPWSSGGVLKSSKNVTAVIIDGGAHHLDLMFSNPQDPLSVKEARRAELAHVKAWIQAARNPS